MLLNNETILLLRYTHVTDIEKLFIRVQKSACLSASTTPRAVIKADPSGPQRRNVDQIPRRTNLGSTASTSIAREATHKRGILPTRKTLKAVMKRPATGVRTTS